MTDSEASGSDCAVPDDLVDWLEEFEGGPILASTCGADSDDEADAAKFRPAPHEIALAADGWAEAAGHSLSHNGFCTLLMGADGTPPVPEALCERCRTAAEARLDALLARARARGLNPRREKLLFRDICSRTAGGLRYDMKYPMCSVAASSDVDTSPDAVPDDDEVAAAWAELRSAVERWVAPVLQASGLMRADEKVLGEDETGGGGGGGGRGVGGCDGGISNASASAHEIDSVGCVTSFSGAPDQHFHPDGTARGLVNVFVPLIDVGALNGATELRPGSHVWEQTPWGPAQRWDERTTQPVAPALHAGELLLFDYRVLHRGRANASGAARPVAYVLFARPGVRDDHNFAQEYEVLLPRSASEGGAAVC